MKKASLLLLITVLLVSVALSGCNVADLIPGGITGNSDTPGGTVTPGKLADGKWPASVYSKYGIDEIQTGGKLVYTQFGDEGSYQYEVYYKGVTRDELVNWVKGLLAQGCRISDRDMEHIEKSKYDYDTMIYLPGEKQPYRMRLSFDFENDMSFEYYADPNPAYVIETEKEDGEEYYYVRYNLTVSLNPLKTETEFDSEFPSLGLKAEELKLNDNVRAVKLGEASFLSSISIVFYTDHIATEEEFIGCRNLVIDKLAEKGAKFYPAIQDKELTAEELKEAGYGTFYVVKDDNKFMFMTEGDSTYNDFGSYYQFNIGKQN